MQRGQVTRRRSSRIFSGWRFHVIAAVDSLGLVPLSMDGPLPRGDLTHSGCVNALQRAARKVLSGARSGLKPFWQPFELCETLLQELCASDSLGTQEQHPTDPWMAVDSFTSAATDGSSGELQNDEGFRDDEGEEKEREDDVLGSTLMDVVEGIVISLCHRWLLRQYGQHGGSHLPLLPLGGELSYPPQSHQRLSHCCVRYNPSPWNLERAISALEEVQYQRYSQSAAIDNRSLNRKTLRSIVGLSCAQGSIIREAIVHHCADALDIASLLFQRIVQVLYLELTPSIYLPTSMSSTSDSVSNSSCLSNAARPLGFQSSSVVSPSDQSTLASCHASPCHASPCLAQTSLSCISPASSCIRDSNQDAEQHRFQSLSNNETKDDDQSPLYSFTADLSDLALLSVLDYAFHLFGVHCASSLSNSSDSDAHGGQSQPVVQEQLVGSPVVSRTTELGQGGEDGADLLGRQDAVECTLPALLYSSLNVVSGHDSVIVLVSGSSGCGKSTLSCLLANRLGVGTVLSTDTIRHILRSVLSQKDHPLLYASTYDAGRLISVEQLLKTRTESIEKACAALMTKEHDGGSHTSTVGSVLSLSTLTSSRKASTSDESWLEMRRCVEGYLQQSEMLYDRIEFIISQLVMNGESLIVEGVHLTTDFIERIRSRFPHQVVPFLVYLSNAGTHVDRFANRSRNFNTEPTTNKYIECLENIRTIQRYLRCRAEGEIDSAADQGITGEEAVVLIDNASISSSIRLMHKTVVEHLRKRGQRRVKRIQGSSGECLCLDGASSSSQYGHPSHPSPNHDVGFTTTLRTSVQYDRARCFKASTEDNNRYTCLINNI